ncbi:MAG: glycoside hydrolase family 3 N-terminal domain-containing protein, partial [Spirochaetota bacterium]
AIVAVAPAGFILYPWNFTNADDVRRLTESLQFVASRVTPGISLLLSSDQEGGRVATFRFPEFVRFPSAAAVGRFGDESLVRSASYITARQLRDLGMNMNLAPVLDLYGVPDDSIIGDRSFGPDPNVVSRFVRPYLEASDVAGVIATAKHFPGHGVTTVDSHAELPIVDLSREELLARHLLPFREAIEADVPAIMTGHLLFRRIDPFYPVTLSGVFLHDLLRHELGFEGVVVTDGLEMRALRDNYSLPETLVRLFKFDVDLILLYQEYDVVDMVRLVEELIEAGELTEDDVNRGVRRVLAMKRRYGLIDPEVL